MSNNKFIVIHSGSRDNYQLALALEEQNMLKYFVTDDYILRKQKPPELKKYVKTSYGALILALVYKVFPSGKINILKDKILSLFAYNLVKYDKNVAVISYSYYAAYIFHHFKGRKILFQLHPHPLSIRRIFENEIVLNPISKDSLKKEHEFLMNSAELNRLVEEPIYANHIIVSSTFTKNTLLDNGIESNKIKVVPYGVSQNNFKEKPAYQRVPGKLKVIFVGSWNQRKGLSYLASSIKNLQTKGLNIQLTIIGRGIIDKNLVLQYNLKDVEYGLNLPLNELINRYHESDVFVLPSLCEGFGHVILEAMSCGLPVITTENTAGPDLLTEGVNGFIVPINNVEILSQRLEYLYYNPEENIKMGRSAAGRAKEFTWEKFRRGIITTLDEYE